MKKLLLIISIAIFGLTITASKIEAQVLPGITIQAAGDTLWTWPAPCQVPDTSLIFVYGSAGGYLVTDSANIYIAFGDGSDTTFNVTIAQNYFLANIYHVYTLPGIYSLQFIVTGPDGDADTVIQNNTLIVANQCGNISGNVFLDANNDCINNLGDMNLQWYQVRLWYSGSVLQTVWTDVNGNYAFNAPTGYTYTVDVYNPNITLNTSCPVGGNYTISTLPATNKDFALTCPQAGFDLTGNLFAWGVRPNLNAHIYFGHWNMSCMPVSGTVTVTLPTGLTFVSGNPAPTNVSGQVLTYNVASFNFYPQYQYSQNVITVLGSPSLVIGDTLCINMVVDPQVGDLNPSNNVIQCCVPVVNSCDPNEKYEIHAGKGTANILPNTELDYTIFFQNVGNDVAYQVNVIDNLDSDLDLNSLKVVTSSHSMKIYKTGNDLKFEFNNINLAAASVNEPASHGFVRYKISPKPNLPHGTLIENDADIFFDFNGAITTNTVTDIIDISLGMENNSQVVISCYPNPAKNSFLVRTGINNESTLKIYNAQGEEVLNKLINDNEVISVADFASGIYSLNIFNETIQFKSKLVVVK